VLIVHTAAGEQTLALGGLIVRDPAGQVTGYPKVELDVAAYNLATGGPAW
jgi:hypothetical protein